MCSQIKKYSRNSFDRFGDDLCEEILRYLPLSDCFGLQCVNKQFKHLIFNKQTKLSLSDGKSHCYHSDNKMSIIKELFTNYGENKFNSTMIYDLLNYVTKKCVNINHIVIDGNYVICEQTISITSDTCKRVKHLSIYKSLQSSEILIECWKRFAENSLQNLESIKLLDEVDTDIIALLIQLCPKLKKIYTKWEAEHYIYRCFDANTGFGTHLESVHHICVDDERFKTFADRFKHQIKSLSVWLYEEKKIDLMKYLSEFKNLEYLHYGCEDIKLFKLIGLKCLRLRVVKVDDMYFPVCDAFNSGFQSLQKLIIKSCNDCSENFEFLKKCVRLTHLVLYDYYSCDGSEFNDIHLYLPQLMSIDIYVYDYIMRQTLVNIMKHLEKLTNLCDLKIGSTYVTDEHNDCCGITTDDVVTFIANCSPIRMITIYPRDAHINKNIIREYIERNNRRIEFKTADDMR